MECFVLKVCFEWIDFSNNWQKIIILMNYRDINDRLRFINVLFSYSKVLKLHFRALYITRLLQTNEGPAGYYETQVRSVDETCILDLHNMLLMQFASFIHSWTSKNFIFATAASNHCTTWYMFDQRLALQKMSATSNQQTNSSPLQAVVLSF